MENRRVREVEFDFPMMAGNGLRPAGAFCLALFAALPGVLAGWALF